MLKIPMNWQSNQFSFCHITYKVAGFSVNLLGLGNGDSGHPQSHKANLMKSCQVPGQLGEEMGTGVSTGP